MGVTNIKFLAAKTPPFLLRNHKKERQSENIAALFFYKEIHPNTLAMELIKIIAIHIGAKYFKKRVYSFFRWNAEEYSTSSTIFFKPTARIINKQVERAAKGIIIELVRKSKKSRNAIPKICTKSNVPYPNDDAVPTNAMTTPISKQHLGRLQWSSSSKEDTLVSIKEIALVKAANRNIRKKAMPTTDPIPILENILGSVIKVREGPAFNTFISPPENANTAGIIISPAKRAIAVSKNSTCVVDFSMSTSFPI